MNVNPNLCNNELRKAGLLLIKASELGMDLDCFGEIDMNENTGNVYLWCENHQFSLYIDLGSDTIWACWTDFNNGDEVIIDATNESLYSLDDWVRENMNRTQPYDQENEVTA